MRCPCRKKSEDVAYDTCCGPYHAGTAVAQTAEALMRSRYAAFVMENAAYLLATWHPSSRPASIPFTPGQHWLLLRVLASSSAGDAATVEFQVRSRIAGKTTTLHETSRFKREGGRWFYVDGDIK